MIPPVHSEPNSTGESVAWRHELRCAIRNSRELLEALGLQSDELFAECDDSAEFAVLVPHGFLARMRHGDPADPLLLQVLARRSEHSVVPGFVTDPLQERSLALDGVLQKYAHRALLIATAACPIHCRYCFRRHFPYTDHLATRARWSQALERLGQSRNIEEVILSGGDPLSLATHRLAELVAGLEEIPTVTTLRIHTRFPIVVPSRVTAEFLGLLERTRLRTVVVVHSNHANELNDESVHTALRSLARSANLVLNQSVLLRGINDSVSTLRALSYALLDLRVSPYYLHLLDRVAGTAHFDVPETEAISLVEGLRQELPGYLVPQLVRESPGALSKRPVY